MARQNPDVFALRSTRPDPPICNFEFKDSINSFFAEVRDSVYEDCNAAIRSAMGKNEHRFVQPKLVTYCMDYIKNGDYDLFVTDKDGGFALVPKGDTPQMCAKVFASGCYEPIHIHDMDDFGEEVFNEYKRVVYDIAGDNRSL